MGAGLVHDGAPARRIRVVVADDTPDMRLLLRLAMERRPEIEVVGEAANGQEAIDLAAGLRPDLLVLDLAMPVLDGLSALPGLAAVAPETRIVVLSAMPARSFALEAMSAGAAAFVQKSTSVESLVDELLRGASLLDAVVERLGASAEIALTRDTVSPSKARSFVASTLTGWRESGLVDTIELLVTELVTNVIVHTSAAPAVRVSLFPDRVHVEVVDTDPTPARARQALPSATSGRGLALVDALAVAWGSVEVDDGKVVWFDVSRAERGSGART
jgi:DNA-binding NarL/FixJ family response regulator